MNISFERVEHVEEEFTHLRKFLLEKHKCDPDIPIIIDDDLEEEWLKRIGIDPLAACICDCKCGSGKTCGGSGGGGGGA